MYPLTLFDYASIHHPEGQLAKRDAYYEHKFSGKLSQQHYAVLDVIKASQDGITRNAIAARLGIPLASVCGRVNELIESGHAEHRAGRREGKRSLVFARKT